MLLEPPQARRAIEHAVDEFVAIGGAKAAREIDRFVDHDAERNLGPVLQLVAADQQQRVFHRIELRRAAIEQRRERGVEFVMRAGDGRDQRLEVFAIGPRHVGVARELLYQILPFAGIELPAIQRLQRQLARHRAGAGIALDPPAHVSRRSRLAIASAVSSASPPLLSASGAARSSACARVSTVSTPKLTGTPVSSITRCRPCAHWPATNSKCAVSPRITQPRATTASTSPCSASALAASGSSRSRGTCSTCNAASVPPCLRHAARAASSSASTMSSL